MSRFAKIILPIVILAVCVLAAWITVKTRKEPERRQPPSLPLRIDAVRIVKQSYPVSLKSRGTVRPRTESDLIPEVSGAIVKVPPSFREGGFFEKGDVLLEIDPLNYRTAIVVAEGNRARAKVAYEEEKARAAQAVENWRELGGKGPPNELALRRPQLAEAEANIEAANAELERAQRNLDRTIIRAPFAGRILTKNVGLGQYVTPGTVLGKIFAVDYVEIRLPLTNRQLSFIDLPMQYRGDSTDSPAASELNYPPVEFTGQLGRKRHTWRGRVVRVEGAIDERSRQLFVVAHVDDPYAHRDDGTPPLMIGLFVEAAIEGNVLKDVFIVPRTAVRADSQVILVDDDNRLQRIAIEPLISDEDVIVVAAGPDSPLEEGKLLCVTPLSFAANGVKVIPTVEGEAPPPEQPLTGPPGKPRPGGPPPPGGRKKPGPPKPSDPAT